VRDSGPGSAIDGSSSGGGPSQGGGFGLRHTRERLQQSYGDRGRLALTSTEDGGTLAEVRLPYHAAASAS